MKAYAMETPSFDSSTLSDRRLLAASGPKKHGHLAAVAGAG
jgi:hypothetical protein